MIDKVVEGSRDWSVRLLPPERGRGEEFVLQSPRGTEVVQLHDYATVYSTAGLYERVVQDMLKCESPIVAARLLARTAMKLRTPVSEIRALDLGAGNGVSGAYLRDQGIKHIVAIDSVPEARDASERDRPGLYDQYEIAESPAVLQSVLGNLQRSSLNTLVCVGALGGGHVPASGLIRAINILSPPAIVVLTIDERWFRPGEREGSSGGLASLIESNYLKLLSDEAFIHRIDTNGDPINYRALAAVRLQRLSLDLGGLR